MSVMVRSSFPEFETRTCDEAVSPTVTVGNESRVDDEVGWSDIEEAKQVIWKFVKLGKVRIEQDSKLFKELELTKTGDKQIYPAVHALMCCLCGIERYPWRKGL